MPFHFQGMIWPQSSLVALESLVEDMRKAKPQLWSFLTVREKEKMEGVLSYFPLEYTLHGNRELLCPLSTFSPAPSTVPGTSVL